ncbi:MAG: amidohydrolase family protein [Candidatus Odinarchaeota archaeon]
MASSEIYTFYDIHCHTMDLSHPCLYAFMKRYTQLIPLAGSAIGFLAQIKWIFSRRKIKNLLSIMERSIEEMLYAMERELPILEIHEGQKFGSMVITPLMMDFWSHEPQESIDYPFVPKSIIPQVTDVFNGIATFARTTQRKTNMKVFPFMGLNTTYCYLKGKKEKPYENTELEKLLDKYFGIDTEHGKDPYQGTRAALEQSFGTFEGDIEKLGRNCFAGIKLYPPLGFDPWPDPKKNSHENKKVKYLYSFCQENDIPITAHCSDGGYIVGSKQETEKRAHPRKWKDVLSEFSKLKLNLAHFGGKNAGFRYAATGNPFKSLYQKIRRGGDPKWVETIIDLINTYENVYTDMSFSGVNKDYYRVLAHIIKKHQKLKGHLLFGTDFFINLTHIRSYKEYIVNFLDTPHLMPDVKFKLCHSNPERFLFGH